MNVAVLGAGRVGSAIALDLASDSRLEVSVVDRSEKRLGVLGAHGLATVRADLQRRDVVTDVASEHDLVVGAVPGSMGFDVLHGVISAGTNVVDISFFDEDPGPLDALARERGVVALIDCGVAPGCSNLVLGHLEATLERTRRFECLVGGLPRFPEPPFFYKAPFSPADVIEEYTRPARLRLDGKEVTRPALSDLERVDIEGVGTLEAFNTDGLRTLLTTCRTPTMVEKTLRYPGHASAMEMLRQAGFFDRGPVEIDGQPVRPRRLAARLLEKAWTYTEGEEDLTVMRIVVEGSTAGRPVRHTFDLVDRYDRATGTSSMARTTGYTCTALVRLVASGRYQAPGVAGPEVVAAEEGHYRFVMEELASRGVVFTHTETFL